LPDSRDKKSLESRVERYTREKPIAVELLTKTSAITNMNGRSQTRFV